MRLKRLAVFLMLAGLVVSTLACHRSQGRAKATSRAVAAEKVKPLPIQGPPVLRQVVEAAIDQTNYTSVYDPAYVKLDYPGGDVPLERGACTDVIVRAFRKGGADLQQLVHEDMEKEFAAYPRLWGLQGPDANIDHRRVLNLMTYFKRQSKERPITEKAEDYLPGDVVAWDLGGGMTHIGMVTNIWSDETHNYLIVHNIGAGAKVENVLFAWRIMGHYRYF